MRAYSTGPDGDLIHPDYLQTANFLEIIRKCWNVLNVKTRDAGIRQRDPLRQPVRRDHKIGLDFLKEFVKPVIPWAHIDIAGPVWSDKGRSTDPAGATGYGVRTLVEWCQAVAADAKEGLSQG